MLLAPHIKDMNPEELFALIQPFLYLVPLAIVVIAVVVGIKIYQSLAVKRMLAYMEAQGETEANKRAYLTNYLTRTSQRDLIKHLRNCPVCGKKYSLKKEEINERGDITETWNHDGCTFCKTKVYFKEEIDHKKYFGIKRTATNSPKEDTWQSTFNKLENYIDFYHPYLDCTPDSSSNDINVTITFR